MPDLDAEFAAELADTAKPPARPRDLLPQAARALLVSDDADVDTVWDRLNAHPSTLDHLAALLKAVHTEWAAAGELRRIYGNGDQPMSATETAAVAIARIILNQPEPGKNNVPPMDTLLDGCDQNYRGEPT